MRLFIFIPHLHPALARRYSGRTLISIPSKVPCTAVRPHCPRARRLYCSQPHTPSIDDDMGKEDKAGKNFNLKVPKGTRDCTW